MKKNKMRAVKRGMILGLVCLFLLMPLESFKAIETEEKETVRVGLYEMEGFQYYDEYGELGGYNIDYLKLLSSITGWEYEYVEVEDFQEGCRRLQAKEIDLLAPVMWTEEREKIFAYSKFSFGTEYTVLVTNEDNDELFYEDYENFEGLDVAVVEEYPFTQHFIEFMGEHDFSANLVYYESLEEAKKALKEKKTDALVTSIVDINGGQKLLARFSPQNFYYLTWKDNVELLVALDDAMNRIQNTYPTFTDELLETYYPIYSIQYYSREEQEYIEKKQSVRVAYVDDRAPLSFIGEDGESDGISRRIFDRISELSGLEFEYVVLPKGDITYNYLLDNGIELITGVEYNSANINAKGILLSFPYISAQKVMVSNKDFIFDPEGDSKIAVISGSQTLHLVLKEKFPNMKIVNYDTIEECFEALHKGEVDLLIQNQYVVEGIMSRPKFSEFVVVPIDGFNDQLCFSTIVSLYGKDAMSEKESLLLISVLNKAISRISEDEMDSMIIRGTLENQYQLTVSDFLYNYRYTVILILIALFLAIALVFCLFYIKAKEKEQLKQKTRTDSLTGLLNKETFEKATTDYLQHHSAIGSAFLFIDMDHFKEINDKLGHDVGDGVIKDTAKKIQLLFANFDLVCRFGGDEFCVFVKDIPIDTLEDRLQFANRKLEKVYEADRVSIELSASIGAAYCTTERATYEDLFEMADKAVYEAKDKGRNCFVVKELK